MGMTISLYGYTGQHDSTSNSRIQLLENVLLILPKDL